MNERRGLPLARASTGNFRIPDASAIEKLFSVATTPEAAGYFRDQLTKQVRSVGLSEQFKEVMTEVDHLVDIIKGQRSDDSSYWSGQARDAAVSHFINFQRHLSEGALEALKSKFTGKTIHFDFAMNDKSELLQGFSTPDGNALDEVESEQINAIYSDWLTERGMMCAEGVIYESADDGSKKEDDKGNAIRVDPERYKQLFKGELATPGDEKSQGFATFVEGKIGKKGKPEEKINMVVTDVTVRVYPDLEKTKTARGATSS